MCEFSNIQEHKALKKFPSGGDERTFASMRALNAIQTLSSPDLFETRKLRSLLKTRIEKNFQEISMDYCNRLGGRKPNSSIKKHSMQCEVPNQLF